jgi:hypothetical protein
VALQLREQGFTEAHALLGGLDAWRSAGYPVEPKGSWSAWRRDEPPCHTIPSRHDGDAPMSADPNQIIVTGTHCCVCGVPIAQVYHRDFAMMRVEARSAAEAVGDLASRLRDAIGHTIDPSLREAVRSALSDAQTFLHGESSTPPGRDRSALHRE